MRGAQQISFLRPFTPNSLFAPMFADVRAETDFISGHVNP